MMRNEWVHTEISELWTTLCCRWKLNGSLLNSKPGSHHSLSGGNLRINHLNKDEDAGTYQCLASNSFGTIVSREASLTFACESHSDLWSNHSSTHQAQTNRTLQAWWHTLVAWPLFSVLIKTEMFSLRRAWLLSQSISLVSLSLCLYLTYAQCVQGPDSIMQSSFIWADNEISKNEIQWNTFRPCAPCYGCFESDDWQLIGLSSTLSTHHKKSFIQHIK